MSFHITRFNPYTMDAATVLAVATGRKSALEEALSTLRDNLHRSGAHQHLMVYGPRGRGKSFFLKYLSVQFANDEVFRNCRFILMPEEQSNIRFASDLVRMILSQIEGQGFISVTPLWREPEALWQEHYERLEQWCLAQRKKHPEFMLVVVLENFDDTLDTLDEPGLHRLRHMMEHLPGFTLIGGTPRMHVDGDYNNPIFHIFKHIILPLWKEEDYLNYFERRRRLETERTGRTWTPQQVTLLDAKLRAISQYTGGSPRMAVVLSELLLKDNLVSTAQTLYGLIDELTPYYQDLVKELRKRPNSLALFDALVRLGENLSQSQLAEKVGARQNEISKAFSWLLENGYVQGEKRKSSKEFIYHVSDRVFVLYYRRREVYHDSDYTPIWLLADFLVAFYSEEELREQAFYNAITQPSDNTRDIIRVWMMKKGMPENSYKNEESIWKLFEAAGETSEAFPEVAFDLINEEKYEKAIAYCDSLLEPGKPIDDVVRGNMISLKGYASYMINNFVDAIQYFNLALEYKGSKMVFIWHFLGKSLTGIGQFEESNYAHQKSFDFAKNENNIPPQALNLEQVGWNLQELNRHEEALEAHQKALELWTQEGNISEQAWNLGRIGWNLQQLNRHEEALEANQKALELRTQEGNISEQAWNLGRIGWNLQKLNRHEEALEAHQRALELRTQEGNISEQAWNLGLIGWNLQQLNRHEEALDAHQNALELWTQEGNTSGQTWSLGQICVSLYLSGQVEQTWQHLLDSAEQKTQAFKEWGDIIIFQEKRHGSAAGFQAGNQILHGLYERRKEFDLPACLIQFFAGLLEMKISEGLLKDLANEAKIIFSEPEAQDVIDAALHTVGYVEALRADKGPEYLEGLHPDLSIAVQAIAQAGALK